MAVASIPFLFVRTHTMWGVNVHSTLAGMIANSLSFAVLPAALGCLWRDATDGRVRVRTVLLLILLLASHFFTSVMAGLAAAVIPLLAGRRRMRRAFGVLLAEGGLAGLAMAWWLVPLAAKSEFSMEFGVNWPVGLAATFPAYAPWLLPLAAVAVWAASRAGGRPVWLLVWLGVCAIGLFVAGHRIGPVFVNVRLWPFLFFALAMLAAIGLGHLLRRARGVEWAVAACLAGVLAGVERLEQGVAEAPPARAAAEWNFEGLERKPFWPVFEKLVLPLRGTPGRLANDLAPENNALGSTRVFEAVPHLAGKAVLEGGLVNSAIGSMFSYYVQSETSENPAGFPALVKPGRFDPVRATRHLRLFNVKHFIARGPALRAAFRAMPEWKTLDEWSDWTLFELTSHDGSSVFVPGYHPIGVRTDRWKVCAMEWLYTIGSLDQPFAFLRSRQEEDRFPGAVIGEAQFRQYLAARRGGRGAVHEWLRLGPFPYPAGMREPIEFVPIAEAEADPVEGDKAKGRIWALEWGDSPFHLSQGRGVQHVSYGFVNVFSSESRAAVLHFSNDDGARIWLNGELVADSGLTGLGVERSVVVRLNRGRNRLLHKLEQKEGGEFMSVRLTDAAGRPFPDLVCTAERRKPLPIDLLRRAVAVEGRTVVSERLGDREIAFRTLSPGMPHIVRVSYYPNWRAARGAPVYMVSPAFMLVYPRDSDCVLAYGRTGADRAGLILAGAGWLLVLALALAARGGRPRRAAGAGRIRLMKAFDATVGLSLCWLLGWIRYLCGRTQPVTADFRGRSVGRILVVRPGGMGDMILLVPVLKQLIARFPGAVLDVVCENRNVDILRLAGLGACALPYDGGFLRLAGRLIGRRYDIAIDTEQFHHLSAVIAFMSGAPIRVGFKLNPSRNILYTHLINYDLDGYEGRQFMRLLEPLGGAGGDYVLEGSLSAKGGGLPEAEAADLARLGEGGRAVVAVHLGASIPHKRWGLSRFIRFVQGLVTRGDVAVALLGTAEDREDVEKLLRYIDLSGGRGLSLVGRLTLLETAVVLQQVRLFVGSDSGLAHMAAALGTDTVVLFGPSDPLKWGIDSGRHRVVRKPLACAPCCIFGYHRLCRTAVCMADITAEDVLKVCEELLSVPPGGGAPDEPEQAAAESAREAKGRDEG